MKIVSVMFNHRLLKNSISPFYAKKKKKKDMIKEKSRVESYLWDLSDLSE